MFAVYFLMLIHNVALAHSLLNNLWLLLYRAVTPINSSFTMLAGLSYFDVRSLCGAHN